MKGSIYLLLFSAIWIVIVRLDIAVFQMAFFDSVASITLYLTLFIIQPWLHYKMLKYLLPVKSILFWAVLLSLISGLTFIKYRLVEIDHLLRVYGAPVSGVIVNVKTKSQIRRNPVHQVRANYQIMDTSYITPVYNDASRSLQLGDTVTVIYARSHPSLSVIR